MPYAAGGIFSGNMMDNVNDALRVNVVAGAGSGGTAMSDEGAFTEGGTSITPIGGVYNESFSAPAGEDWAAAARITSYRALHVNLRDAAGNEVAVGGGTQYTVDAVAPANPIGNALLIERDDQLSSLAPEINGDWTNARATASGALWVAIADSSGDPITSFGGGTQYTEDVAAPADPVGAALIMVRDDVLSAQTSNDGDNIGARGTDKGELYVKHVDSIQVTDGGGAITVDGTVSATVSGSVAISSITAGDNNIGNVDVVSLPALPAGNNNIGDVDVATVPAPLSTTGGGTEAAALRVTIATDSTGLVSVDDNGSSLTVDGTVGISGAVTIQDGGGSITVDGTVTANAGTGTFDVNIVSGSASGTQYTEDVAAAADPVGTALNLIRADSLAAVTTTDGDNVAARGTNKGELYVKHADAVTIQDGGNTITVDGTVGVSGTVTVSGTVAATQSGTWNITNISGTQTLPTGASTLAEQQTQTTALQKIDNIAHSGSDVALSEHVPISGQFDDASTTTVTENNVAPVRITSARGLHVSVRDAIPAGTNNIGDVDILSVPAPLNVVGGGTEAAAQRVTIANNSTGVLTVAQATAASLNMQAVGPVAHDSPMAANPQVFAGAAQDSDDTAPPNRVSAESDVTRLAVDRDGSLHVLPFGPQIWSYHSDGSTALTDASVHAAPGSGLSLYVGTIAISTGAATAMNVFFEEGATKVLGPYYLEAVAGRGLAIQFNPPKKITANTALTITTSASILQSIDVTGYTAQG